jgi:hypothetical protein
VFGETAVDPTLDPNGISDVLLCLRSLVDFEPTESESTDRSSSADRDEWVWKFDQFAREFDIRCSEAMRAKAPWRLRALFDVGGPVYFSGYMAVRSVVAAWRHTLGRAESGTRLFNLLLHATRYGTFDAIPDLSVPIDRFAQEAVSLMASWAENLVRLPGHEIEDFVRSDGPEGYDRFYLWTDGHIIKVPKREQASFEFENIAKTRISDILKNAFLSETNELRSSPSPVGDEQNDLLQAMIDELRKDFRSNIFEGDTFADWLQIFHRQIQLNSLLPIGQSPSKFALNIGQAGDWSRLWVSLRTTEKHVESGGPSVNGFVFPLDAASAAALGQGYESRAAPRVAATRIIDLGNSLFAAADSKFLHFLVFEYEDWWEVRPAIHALDHLWRQDPPRIEQAKESMRLRLHPMVID